MGKNRQESDELLNGQMSARDKTGLGYGTKLNEMSNNFETDSEISLSVFDVRSSNEENTLANDRFYKEDRKKQMKPILKNLRRYESVNKDKVIIEDWNSDDEDHVTEVQTVSPVKTNETQTIKTRVDKIGVLTRIGEVLTRTGLITPVKKNEKRAVHKVSTARPVSYVRSFAPKIAQTSGAIRPIYPRMDNVRPRGSYSPIKRLDGSRAVVNTGKGKMDTDLKKSRWVWRLKENYLDHVSKDSGSFMLKKGNPEILLQDHAVVDSGCSSHMTGNKAYLSDYEDYNGGFMAFGSDPKGVSFFTGLKPYPVLLPLSFLMKVKLYLELLERMMCIAGLKNIVPLEVIHVYMLMQQQLSLNYGTGLENQLNHNVKIIRCDNGTEFKNHAMNEFCAKKGIKREFSVARTPQQNGVAERKNRTLIEAARTMLADSLLPIPFWAEAVNTACYVLNRVLVTKPQNKTPYELLIGSSGKDKVHTLKGIHTDSLQPYRTRIPVEDVAPTAHEKPSENSPKDNDVHDSEDVANKEGQHQITEDEQVLNDELEKMISQEVVAKALDDATRQAFEEEGRNISQKRATQTT
ncbi:putative ribonuclease H-like domain-containing protein [Tanacetum coccineum]